MTIEVMLNERPLRFKAFIQYEWLDLVQSINRQGYIKVNKNQIGNSHCDMLRGFDEAISSGILTIR